MMREQKKTKRPDRETQSPEETAADEHVSEPVAENAEGAVGNDPQTESQESPETGRKPADDTDKADALQEKYIRLIAEYDNYRKRVAKEREQLYQMATGDLMKEMLPVLDNLDRATEHRNSETSLEEYVNGITLIEDQLRTVLSHAGLEKMEVVGQPFDPLLHDAVMQMESDEFDSGTVAQEVEKGYLLRGRVIRHAKVIVAK